MQKRSIDDALKTIALVRFDEIRQYPTDAHIFAQVTMREGNTSIKVFRNKTANPSWWYNAHASYQELVGEEFLAAAKTAAKLLRTEGCHVEDVGRYSARGTLTWRVPTASFVGK
jgi:hypothetical protein